MRNKLLLLLFIWTILTTIISSLSYYLFPSWRESFALVVVLIAGAALAALAILDNLSGALELIGKVFPDIEHWGYKNKYCQHLFHLHKDFDVKGLRTQGFYSLELSHVFVELSLNFESLHSASTATVPLKLEDTYRHYLVWELLKLAQFRDRNFVLLGPPGSGKTTLLKHIALVLANNNKYRHLYLSNKLPIFVSLRDHVNSINRSHEQRIPYVLTDAVASDFALHDNELPKAWLRNQLLKGHCLVMFDGLDEVANPELRRIVVAWVQRQMEAYATNRFLISSRPHGYRNNLLNGVILLAIQPFSPAQIENFVTNWYWANEIIDSQKNKDNVHLIAQKKAKGLLQRLNSSRELSQLMVNPLLLTMISTVDLYRGKLPEKRVALYDEIFEVFLGEYQQAKGLKLELSPTQSEQLLKPLAYYMMKQRKLDIDIIEAQVTVQRTLDLGYPKLSTTAFLEFIENNSGLLLQREPGKYSFAHNTFQEYLAAVHIMDYGLDTELTTFVSDEWWYETLRFYAELGNANSVIQSCLLKRYSITALTLAVECLDEDQEISPQAKDELLILLEDGLEAEDPERRHLAAEVKLKRRLLNLARVDELKEMDPGFISNAEYQLFLDDMRLRRMYFQPDHWHSFRFPPGAAQKAVVGVRWKDVKAFCEWLTIRTDSQAVYRVPGFNELKYDTEINNFPKGWWVYDKGKVSVEPHKGIPDASKITAFQETLFTALTRDLNLEYAHEMAERLFKCKQETLVDIKSMLYQIIVHTLSSSLTLDLESAVTASPILNNKATNDIDKYFVTNLTVTLAEIFGFNYRIVGIIDRVVNIVLHGEQGLKVALEYILDRDYDRALHNALDRLRGIAIYFDQFFASSQGRESGRVLAHSLKSTYVRSALLDFIRFYTITAAASLQLQLLYFDAKNSFINKSSRKEDFTATYSVIERLRDAYLELYVQTLILKTRTDGILPAIEGIRLIREIAKPAHI